MRNMLCIMIVLLPAMLFAAPDTLQHVDSLYDCMLSAHMTACCTQNPSDPCNKINLGYQDYFGVGKSGSGIGAKNYSTLYGLHLGGRDTTNLDSVILLVYCYTNNNNDSSLPLRANPLLADIVTVTDTLQWRFGHYYYSHCEDDINDSSPTWNYRVRDSADGVGISWNSSGCAGIGTDWDDDIFDSITITGTGWHRIPITNCVRAAMDSGYTYCDMILRDKEFYFSISPFHLIGGTTDGYMSFRAVDYYDTNYRSMVIFYYADEGGINSRRRKVLTSP